MTPSPYQVEQQSLEDAELYRLFVHRVGVSAGPEGLQQGEPQVLAPVLDGLQDDLQSCTVPHSDGEEGLAGCYQDEYVVVSVNLSTGED